MRFFILLCAIIAWSVPARSAVLDKDFRLSQITSVKVVLMDQVTAACWTNLKEVREYAEEKLRMKGAKVDNEQEHSVILNNTYTFAIEVGGRRANKDNTGPCYGGVMISLYSYDIINNLFHKAVIGEIGTYGINHKNLNRYVIEAVSEFIAELE